MIDEIILNEILKFYFFSFLFVEPIASPWYLDRHQSRIEFIFLWPITFLLWLTVPNCRFIASRKYFTLFMSIIWISAISYVMAFVITVIGELFCVFVCPSLSYLFQIIAKSWEFI